MQYNPLVKLNKFLGVQERDANDSVYSILKREYLELDYDAHGKLSDTLVEDLGLFSNWNTTKGDRMISIASHGNYFDFCNIEIARQAFPSFSRLIATGCLLMTTLPTSIPGTTRIFSDSSATRLRYHNEHIAFKKGGFTVYSTAPDKDLFHYVDTVYLMRLRQMCEKLGADVAICIEGNRLIALY